MIRSGGACAALFRYRRPAGGAEDSYGIEDRDRVQIGSKNKDKASGAEEAAGETEKRRENCRARQGRQDEGS